MRRIEKIFIFLVFSFIITGCAPIAMKDDMDLLKNEINQKIDEKEAVNSKKFEQINETILQIQKNQEQQQSILMGVSEDIKNQIRDLKASIDDVSQQQSRELENFKKIQEEKNNRFSQDIETLRKAQNDLIKSSASLTDAMVNYQKDLLAVKTAIGQLAREIDSFDEKKFARNEDLQNMKKEIASQIQTLLNEIVRHESEIFALKQAVSEKNTALIKDVEIKKETAVTYHTVKKGETLSSIARKYNTTTKKIKELNKMKNDNVQVGQKLLIQ